MMKDLDSNEWKTWLEKGLNFWRSYSENQKAIECFNKSIESNPDNWKSWYYKGFTYLYIGNFQEGINCVNKGIELAPEQQFIKLSSPSQLKYYSCIFKFLGICPLIQKNKLISIDIDRDSVKEWYSLEGMLDFYNKFGSIHLVEEPHVNDAGFCIMWEDYCGSGKTAIKSRYKGDPKIYWTDGDPEDPHRWEEGGNRFSQAIQTDIFTIFEEQKKRFEFRSKDFKEKDYEKLKELVNEYCLGEINQYTKFRFYNQERSILIIYESYYKSWRFVYVNEDDLMVLFKRILTFKNDFNNFNGNLSKENQDLIIEICSKASKD